MLLALSTGQKVGLAGVAAAFVAFAALSALVIPRWRPDFPGERGRNWFILATVALFVAMLGAVEVFAKEEETEGEAVTEVTGTETRPETQPATPQPPAGDAVAGKALFTSQGCGGCHALAAAGTQASVGPNLDESLEGKNAEYVLKAIVEPNAEIASGFAPGLMPQDYGDKLSEEQLDDLVALLTQP